MATPSAFSLYCDESGNTGKNFADRAQPIFVEGGWYVADDDRAQLEKAVLELEKAAGYSGTEIKGAKLVGSAKGREFLKSLADALGPNTAPYFYLVEKKYAICAKIVESLFDPAYNPKVDDAETWDPDTRQGYAQRFYDGPEELIYEFGDAYREKDASALCVIAKRWSEYFEAVPDAHMCERIDAVLPQLSAELTSEFGAYAGERGMDSLNMPIWVMLFQDMENHFPYPCRIIHDRAKEFEPLFQKTFDQFKAGPPRGHRLKDGRPMSFGIEKVLSLEFRDSKDEPLIRAADCLMAATREFAVRAFSGKPIDANLAAAVYPTVGGFVCWILAHMHPSLGPFPQLGTIMGSQQFSSSVFKRGVELTGPNKNKAVVRSGSPK